MPLIEDGLDPFPDYFDPIGPLGIDAALNLTALLGRAVESRWVHIFGKSPVSSDKGYGISDIGVFLEPGSTTSKWCVLFQISLA